MVNDARFGPYDLLRLVGRGGMGEVFEAYDREHRRAVALKRLVAHLAHDEEFQQRFRRESRLAAQLSSPHVIPIHRFGEIDGLLFIEMRLVRGTDLEQDIRRHGPLAPARVVGLLEQIAWALDDAHRAGLVHRDVKPANVLLDVAATRQEFVYLTDFGLTRSVGGSGSMTSTHTVVGSLDYMAPEQFDGRVTPAVDVYSLGCLLFRCLTGLRPFQVDGFPAVMRAHISAPAPMPSQYRPELGCAFDGVIARALAKNPDERFESAGALAAAAREALAADDPVDATGATDITGNAQAQTHIVSVPAAPVPPEARSAPRRRSTTIAVALVVLALAGAGVLAVSVGGHVRSGTEVTEVAASVAARPLPPPTDLNGLLVVLRNDQGQAGIDGPELDAALGQVAVTDGEQRRQASLAVLRLVASGHLSPDYAQAATVAVTPFTQLSTAADMIEDLAPGPDSAGPNAHFVLNCMRDLVADSPADQKAEADEILQKLPGWSQNGGVLPDISAAARRIAQNSSSP